MPGVDFWINSSGAKTGADQYIAALLRIDRSAAETAAHIANLGNVTKTAGEKMGSGGGAREILGLITGFGGLAAVVVKAVEKFHAFIEEASHLKELSERFDLPVETLSALGEQAKQSGASIDEVARALQHLAVTRGQATADTRGTGDASKAFQELAASSGLLVDKSQQLQPLFLQTAKAISALSDASEKAALAQKIFGRSGGELVPFFERIAHAKGDIFENIRVTEQAAEAAKHWHDSLIELDGKFTLALSHLAPLIDATAEFFDTINGKAQIHTPTLPLTEIGQQLTDALKAANAAQDETKRHFEALTKSFNDFVSTRAGNRNAALDQIGAAPTGSSFLEQLGVVTDEEMARRKAFLATEQAALNNAERDFIKLHPEYASAAKAIAQADRDRADALEDLHRAQAAHVTGVGDPKAPQANDALDRVNTSQQAFIDKLLAQAAQLKVTGFAAEALKIKNEALAQGWDLGAEKATKFGNALEGAIRTLREATAIASAKTAIEGLETAIESVGKTEAQQRLIEFNKALKDIGSTGTGIDLLRQKFELFNATLERTKDADVFKKQTDAMKEELGIILLSINAREQEAAVLELMRATQNRATQEQQNAVRALVAQKQQLDLLQKAADNMANAFTTAFESAITGASSLKDALKSLLQELEKIGIQTFFSAPAGNALSGLFTSAFSGLGLGAHAAHGGVFGFARGGVVTKPTLFQFAGGAGLMGEAGPEAVMPLRHGPGGLSIRSDALGGLLPIGRVGGDLGVKLFGSGGLVPSGAFVGGSDASGGDTIVHLVQNVNIRGGSDAAGSRRSARQMAGDFRRELQKTGGA